MPTSCKIKSSAWPIGPPWLRHLSAAAAQLLLGTVMMGGASQRLTSPWPWATTASTSRLLSECHSLVGVRGQKNLKITIPTLTFHLIRFTFARTLPPFLPQCLIKCENPATKMRIVLAACYSDLVTCDLFPTDWRLPAGEHLRDVSTMKRGRATRDRNGGGDEE